MFAIAYRITPGDLDLRGIDESNLSEVVISGYFEITGDVGFFGYLPPQESDEVGCYSILYMAESMSQVLTSIKSGRYAAFLDIETECSYLQFEVRDGKVFVEEGDFEDCEDQFLEEKPVGGLRILPIAVVDLGNFIAAAQGFLEEFLTDLRRVNVLFEESAAVLRIREAIGHY